MSLPETAENKTPEKNKKQRKIRCFFIRAEDGTRTRDLLTTNEVRYRLCHSSLCIVILFHENSCSAESRAYVL